MGLDRRRAWDEIVVVVHLRISVGTNAVVFEPLILTLVNVWTL